LKWNDFSFNSFESASFPSESLLIFSYTYYSLSIFLHDPPGTKKDCWRESLISYSIFTNLLSMILPLDRFIMINFLYSVLYLFWIIRSISVSSLLMILSLNLQIVTSEFVCWGWRSYAKLLIKDVPVRMINSNYSPNK
jgi:hypothetical protein